MMSFRRNNTAHRLFATIIVAVFSFSLALGQIGVCPCGFGCHGDQAQEDRHEDLAPEETAMGCCPVSGQDDAQHELPTAPDAPCSPCSEGCECELARLAENFEFPAIYVQPAKLGSPAAPELFTPSSAIITWSQIDSPSAPPSHPVRGSPPLAQPRVHVLHSIYLI